MTAIPPVCDFGWPAPAFQLTGTDGKTYSLDDLKGLNGTVVVFMCNHCPYVKHVAAELGRLGSEYGPGGVAIVAIGSNDVENYPDDSPAKMAEEAKLRGYTFPYLYDETQEVAKAYRAACTPTRRS